jgi:hypothetical protein
VPWLDALCAGREIVEALTAADRGLERFHYHLFYDSHHIGQIMQLRAVWGLGPIVGKIADLYYEMASRRNPTAVRKLIGGERLGDPALVVVSTTSSYAMLPRALRIDEGLWTRL